MSASLSTLAQQLKEATHGAQGGLVARYATNHGVSAHTVYKWLREVGYHSGRKPRGDTGKSKLSDQALHTIGGLVAESRRANGKVTMPIPVAMNIAHSNGIDIPVSASRVNTLLRGQRMNSAAQARARVHQPLRSLHPNHVHQIDPSLCLLFYMHGKQRLMREEEFNKNKLENFAKVKLKVWRYVRYDHASGSLDVQYYEAAGENQAALFEFLMHTWGVQPPRLSHGVPKILLWDKGSANTSHGIQKLLDALGVDHQAHATGHAWVKGGVEGGNNIVETHFESRLRVEPVNTCAELNDAVARWVRDYNANAMPHIDSRITRASGESYTRDDLWHRIQPDQLVALPDRAICAYFLTGREETRMVTNAAINFKHPELPSSRRYDLSPWSESLANGETVAVAPLLLKQGALRVTIARIGKEPLVVEVAADTQFDEYGRPMSAQVIGEGYQRPLNSASGLAQEALVQAAWGAEVKPEAAEKLRQKQARPFAHATAKNGAQGLRAHSQLGQEALPQRLPRAAGAVSTPQIIQARTVTVELPPVSIAEACQRIKSARLARGEDYLPTTYSRLAAAYPEGKVPHLVVEAECALEPVAAATGTHGVATGSTLQRIK